MKSWMKTGMVVLCAVSFLHAEEETPVQDQQITEDFSPRIEPSAPMVWTGPGWYDGKWYEDEETYNKDVNANDDAKQQQRRNYNNNQNHMQSGQDKWTGRGAHQSQKSRQGRSRSGSGN